MELTGGQHWVMFYWFLLLSVKSLCRLCVVFAALPLHVFLVASLHMHSIRFASLP
jgi:hypothetical protein